MTIDFLGEIIFVEKKFSIRKINFGLKSQIWFKNFILVQIIFPQKEYAWFKEVQACGPAGGARARVRWTNFA